MMKQVIASCENKFQPFVERKLHQIKAGFLLESELSNAARLEEAVFELCTCAPRVLTQVLPAYTEDLTFEEPDRRIKAIKLLGAIFSVGTFRTDFGQVFSEFKRRTGDKDADVRKTMISVIQHLVLKRPELAAGFLQEPYIVNGEEREAPMIRLVIDHEESVRKQAVLAGVDICLHHGEVVNLAFLEHIGGRVRDKKESVRRAAAEGLSQLWHKHCAPFDRNALTHAVETKFDWIPSKIVGLNNMDQASKNLAAHCVDICLSATAVKRGVEAVALDFFASLDDPATELFLMSLRARKFFREAFLKLCDARKSDGPGYDMEEGAEEEIAAQIKKLSAAFLDASKAQESFEKLEKTQVSKVWEILEGMVRNPKGTMEVNKQQDDVVKRLGPRSPLLDFVKQLIAMLVDPHFGFDFVNHVMKGVSSKSKSKGEAARTQASLRLLPAIAEMNPALFKSQQNAFEKMLIEEGDDKGMAEHFLATLAVTASSLPGLYKNRKLTQHLEDNCTEGSSVVAKHSMRAMAALGQEHFDKLVNKCTAELSLGPKLPAVLRVLLEITKASPEDIASDSAEIQDFVTKKLLRNVWPAGGKKPAAAEARALGMKLAAALLVNAGEHATTAMCDAVLGVLVGMINSGGEVGKESGVPRADKATLRLVAGSCILRVARAYPDLVTPQAFSALGSLFEDEESRVKQTMIKKVFKSRIKTQGALPLQYAGLLCLVAHDSEHQTVELAKKVLKSIVASVIKIKQQTGKAHVAIIPERMLAWLVYVLAVHPEYASEENGASVSIAYKKYLDFFINIMLAMPAEEQCAGGITQLFKHLRKCSIQPAAAGDAEPKDVARNLSLLSQTGTQVSQRLQGSKFSGHYASMHKIVDACIYAESGDAAQTEPAHARTPQKPAVSERSNPASPVAFSGRDISSDASASSNASQQRTQQSTKARAPGGAQKRARVEVPTEEEDKENVEEEATARRPARKAAAPAAKRAAPAASRAARGRKPPAESAKPKDPKRKAKPSLNDSVMSAEDTPELSAPKRKSASKSPVVKTPEPSAKKGKKASSPLTPFDDFEEEEAAESASLASSKKDHAVRRLSVKSKTSPAPPSKPSPPLPAAKGRASRAVAGLPMARASSIHVVAKARASSVHVVADKAALWDKALQDKVAAHGAAARPAAKKKRRI
jgi:hypothetical protein